MTPPCGAYVQSGRSYGPVAQIYGILPFPGLISRPSATVALQPRAGQFQTSRDDFPVGTLPGTAAGGREMAMPSTAAAPPHAPAQASSSAGVSGILPVRGPDLSLARRSHPGKEEG